jgi:hypothetical protein
MCKSAQHATVKLKFSQLPVPSSVFEIGTPIQIRKSHLKQKASQLALEGFTEKGSQGFTDRHNHLTFTFTSLNMEVLFNVFRNHFSVKEIYNSVCIVCIVWRVRHHYDCCSFFI